MNDLTYEAFTKSIDELNAEYDHNSERCLFWTEGLKEQWEEYFDVKLTKDDEVLKGIRFIKTHKLKL